MKTNLLATVAAQTPPQQGSNHDRGKAGDGEPKQLHDLDCHAITLPTPRAGGNFAIYIVPPARQPATIPAPAEK